jgi:hypothetical protein
MKSNALTALEKARDCAVLAVEVYNKPAIKFKSSGYISLMVIAWTSLFHAIFFKRKIKPFYKKENGRYERIGDDYKYWELKYCIKEYFKSDTGNPVRNNLEFFIEIRNRIEHRSFPEIDSDVFGECQSMLFNFDEMIEDEFGEKHCIRECLSFSLQLYPSSKYHSEAVRKNSSLKSVMNFINDFRSSLTSDAESSSKFAFKAFLIQVANHESKDALPIQFVNYDSLPEAAKSEVDKIPALVKYKRLPVINLGLMKPGEVVRRVSAGLGDQKLERYGEAIYDFKQGTHTKCWKKYKVRPEWNSSNPEKTNPEYCIYDEANEHYIYTEKWVEFLIKKMKKEGEYETLYK